MPIDNTAEISSRLEHAETSRLTWAFTSSLALHLLVAGTYYVGHEYGWWKDLHWPAWVKSAKMLIEIFQKAQLQAPEKQQLEVPLVFVEVTPAQATTEVPKETKYYSDKNSTAANPEPTVTSNVPRIDGKQAEMVKTEDVPRIKASPLNPSMPEANANKAKETQPETQPKPTFTSGDLALAKSEQLERKEKGESYQARPRTIKDALALLPPRSQLPGPKMKQNGGVRNMSNHALDVRASPFGDYDGRLISAVQASWDSLLESRHFAGERTGKVTIRFRLHSDGTISKVTEMQSTVDSVLTLLCRMAIEHPAPYEPWPNEMRHKIGEAYRELTFTFFYY